MIARKTRTALGLALLPLLLAFAAPSAAQAAFGIDSLSATAINRDGTVDLEAGSHPYEYVVSVSLNHNSSGKLEGLMREFALDLPPGLLGSPQAVPRCSGADFEGLVPSCPGNTQIGIVEAKAEGVPLTIAAVYNLVPPKGVAAQIGTSLFGVTSFQPAALRPSDYGVSISDVTLPGELFRIQSLTERIWGVPSEPSHDAERQCRDENGKIVLGCPSELGPVPFLNLPTSCGGPLKTTVTVHSFDEPEVPRSATVESLSSLGTPAGLNNCGKVPFEPTIAAQPETDAAGNPTGLHVDVHVPQHEVATQPVTAHLKDAVVNLPAGLVLNPSTANGLAACALAGPEGINLPGSGEPAAGEAAKCPAGSKVGTVEVDTPLLDHPVSGSVYIAKQSENPFHSLIALYVALDDPASGVVVKIPGKVEPDPVTGRLKAMFANNPQLPFEDLKVDFHGGPRAALTTPSVCGAYRTEADLTPWSAPEGDDVFAADTFSVAAGAQGGSCPSSEAEMPNNPRFEAGTTSPLAGSYSPFVLKMSRENGSQHFGSLNVNLPPGIAAKFAGVEECSEAQISQARGRSNLGEGAIEAAGPSCPQASELGTVTIGAGSGAPLYVQGHAYLAGPYKGAPFSIVTVTPAVAGPFDLGTVVVRAALDVNETTAQGTIRSDPFPTILQGIPLDLRSVEVRVDRQQFTLNPTSCEEKAVSAELTSTGGQTAPLSNRFQVGGCKGLEFKPALKLAFSGKTKRSGFPAVKAVLTQPRGENANIAATAVILPKGMFIANAHINNPCTRVQYNSGSIPGEGCPANSVLGTAKVWTPLLEKPEEGKAYFRSNGGERELPDLVIALRGKIPLQLVGFIDSVGKKGSEVSRIRTRFVNLPDAPVSRFELKLSGGKKGLLENSEDLCRSANIAAFNLTGQNGKTYNTKPKVSVKCSKHHKKARKGPAKG